MHKPLSAPGFAFLMLVAMVSSVAVSADEHDPKWSYDHGLIFEDDDFKLKLRNRVQAGLFVKNPDLGDDSSSFDLSRYQVNLSGTAFEDWDFTVQANLTDTDNSSRTLEDAFLVFTRKQLAQLWVGQGKVFFGRQQLTWSGDMQFVHRSLASEEFRHGDAGTDSRDVGVAVFGQNPEKTYGYSFGIYNGNGINKDEDDNSDYMVVSRLVVTPYGEYELTETDTRWREKSETERQKKRLAIGVAARTIKEGTEAINEERRDNTAVLEIAYKYLGLNLVGEFFTRSADPPVGIPGDEEDTDGWYVQGGWLFRNNLEVAARYSEVIRDTANNDETEWGVALNYYFANHYRKVQAEYRQVDFEGVPTTPQIDNEQLTVQLQLSF